MNYRKIYLQIIYRAKYRPIPKTYYEMHHILPRSLGGKDDKMNLVPLTAREHFICHWLLVKMYNKGSKERHKMLYAFWRMQSSPDPDNPRYINSMAYEKLRIEFADLVSKRNRVSQHGIRNSQYGKKWYTNYETGESRSFFNKPSEKWILGRRLYRGESSILFYDSTNLKRNPRQRKKFRSKEDGIRKHKLIFNLIRKNTKSDVELLWNKFHSGNYEKLEDFSKELGISKVALYYKFQKYIPIYANKESNRRQHFCSDHNLINRFS